MRFEGVTTNLWYEGENNNNHTSENKSNFKKGSVYKEGCSLALFGIMTGMGTARYIIGSV